MLVFVVVESDVHGSRPSVGRSHCEKGFIGVPALHAYMY